MPGSPRPSLRPQPPASLGRSLRPGNADDLGLRRALSTRLLPLLAAAMVFLAALALAGASAAAALARHWRTGAASLVTVQVPNPDDAAPGGGARADAVAATLAATPGLAGARRLSDGEIATLLAPWLGPDAAPLALKLPTVFEVRLNDPVRAVNKDQIELATALARAAPGTLVERNGVWIDRLTDLAHSLEACAALALLVVAFIAASVVALATRAAVAARRQTIEIVHGLGATDQFIADRFAARVTALVFAGSVAGLVVAVPVVLGLAQLAAPFQTGAVSALSPSMLLGALPRDLWIGLAALPAVAAVIGWSTAQATVRRWLGRLA